MNWSRPDPDPGGGAAPVLTEDQRRYSADNDAEDLEYLDEVLAFMGAGSGRPACRVYHLGGAHAPFILDTGGRPLSSFQADPLPQLVTDAGALTWDFGTVEQGALLRHRLSLANTGFGGLYTFVDGAGALELTNVGQRTVGAAVPGPFSSTFRRARPRASAGRPAGACARGRPTRRGCGAPPW